MVPELLAPAGDFSSLDAALGNGADAIYAGIGNLNLRARASNFLLDDLPELLHRVHGQGRRIYIALNTMPSSEIIPEIESLLTSLDTLNDIPDALIVSDPGIIELCREKCPAIALHLSTQTGTFNYRSLEFWKKQGIKRAVLPRELTLNQIQELTSRNIIETELFIHGAMCVSISGRCLMGAYMAKRHANQGDCPQPCRWKYRILADPQETPVEPSQEQAFDCEEHSGSVYFLNSRDLSTITILPKIIRSGVTSLKIEGRNKSAHYVGAVVKAYRTALNTYQLHPESYDVLTAWNNLLESVEHRPYTTGFYDNDLELQDIFASKARSTTRVVGIVKALLPPEGNPVVDIKNGFSSDDRIEILPVNQSKMPFPFTWSYLTDLNGTIVIRPPSNRLAVIHGSCRLQPGDMLRKKIE